MMHFNILSNVARGLLLPAVCLLVSCAAAGGGGSAAAAVPAAVKARLKQPVPVVFVGLQDQVSFQKPSGSRDVFLRSVGDSHQIGGDLAPIVAAAPEAGFILAPLMAAALVVPPLTCLATAGSTVSPKKAEAAAGKLRARSPLRDWGAWVRRSVVQQWSGSGRAFSHVKTCDAGMLGLGQDPLGREALAKAGGRTLLYLHVAGPALTAEGDKINPRIAPSLMIYWKVIDTATGNAVAQGTIAERSAGGKTLLHWARGSDRGLETELENVIHRAAIRLATELR